MTRDVNEVKDGTNILDQNHREVLGKTDQFYDALTNLRYEGKVNFGKNVNALNKIMDYFFAKIPPHMKLEDIIFGFLQIHAPKYESALRLLQAEHKEIAVNLDVLQYLLKELQDEKGETKRAQTIDKLKDKGTYFIYLLRHHIQVEDEGIYRTIDEELHPDEKKELVKKIKECEEWKKIS